MARATRSKFGKGTLTVNLVEGIDRERLHNALDEILRRHGCLACGLVGLDLNFLVFPEKEFDKLVPAEGVLGATMRH